MPNDDQNITGSAHVGEAHNSTVIGVQIHYGADTDRVRDEIRSALSDAVKSRPHEEEHKRVFLAPPLPTQYVARQLLLDLIIAQLTADTERGVLRIEGFHGTGGVGKSTLAKAICYAPAITAHFEGVLWAELGPDSKPLEAITRWILALGERDFQPSSLLEASDHLRVRLRGRRMLLVIDDAWQASDVRPFLVAPESVALVTTRRLIVMEELGARSTPVPAMSDTEAATLIERWLGRAITSDERKRASHLILSLDHLPLALELAGSLLGRGVEWTGVQQMFEAEASHLLRSASHIPKQLAKVLGSIRVSVRQLHKENTLAWERFAMLGVLGVNTAITKNLGAKLWVTTEDDAALTLQELHDDALCQRTNNGWFLHDLVREAAVNVLIDGSPDGLGKNLSSVHAMFLTNCGWSDTALTHRTFPRDDYIASHLTFHLEMAGDHTSIHDLLAATNQDGQNAWWAFLSSNKQSAVFLSDLNRAYRLALQNPDPFPLVFRYTAMRSTLKTTVQCISPQVLSALVETGFWDLRQGAAVADQIRSLQKAAEMRTCLAELSVGTATFEGLIVDAHAAVTKLSSSFEKGELAARCCRIASSELRVRLFQIAIDCVLSAGWLFHDGAIDIVALLPPELRGEGIRLILDGVTYPATLATALAKHIEGLDETSDLPSWIGGLLHWCEARLNTKPTLAESAALQDSVDRRQDAPKGESPETVRKLMSGFQRWLSSNRDIAKETPGNPGDKASSGNIPASTSLQLTAPDDKSLASPASNQAAEIPQGVSIATSADDSAGRSEATRQDIEAVLMILFRARLLDRVYVSKVVRNPIFRRELRLEPMLASPAQENLAERVEKISGLADPRDRIRKLRRVWGQLPELLRKDAAEIAIASIKALWAEPGYYHQESDAIEEFKYFQSFIPADKHVQILDVLRELALRPPYEDAGWRALRRQSMETKVKFFSKQKSDSPQHHPAGTRTGRWSHC